MAASLRGGHGFPRALASSCGGGSSFVATTVGGVSGLEASALRRRFLPWGVVGLWRGGLYRRGLRRVGGSAIDCALAVRVLRGSAPVSVGLVWGRW